METKQPILNGLRLEDNELELNAIGSCKRFESRQHKRTLIKSMLKRPVSWKTIEIIGKLKEVWEESLSWIPFYKAKQLPNHFGFGRRLRSWWKQVLRVLNELSWNTTFVSNVVFSINANANLTHETRFQGKLVQKHVRYTKRVQNRSKTFSNFQGKGLLAFGLRRNFKLLDLFWEVLRGFPQKAERLSVGQAEKGYVSFKTCLRPTQTSQVVLEQGQNRFSKKSLS